MKRVIIVTLVLCLLLPATVFGCGQGAGSEGVVNVHNWGEYIDESIFRIFEQETGIKLNYSTYETNEALYSLMRRGGANIDIIIPSDYMIARMIEEDMLEELDFSNIPNFSLIDERYKGLNYDPLNRYSVAYMTGTVGLIYNSALISESITSWGSLFDDRYSGQILMFDNPRDAFGITLKYLGYSLNTVNEDEIREAYELLMTQRPILQAYVMDQIFDKLESGEAWIGPYYAGDFLIMVENNPDLKFARPHEGTNYFVDAMCIPKGAENKTNAELFINFMSRTDIALMNMEYVYYASANYEAAAAFAEELDPEEYAIMFASDDVLANSEVYYHLPRHILELYDELWVELKR
jgi:spermidine/putrescine transport system substrate-binding protein